MRRVYTSVTIAKKMGGFAISLDGKPLKTPDLRPLILPTEKLASMIAREWDSQISTVAPETMPLTQWAVTEADRTTPNRGTCTQDIVGYLDTDLLCYRAPAESDIGKLQTAAWNPVLDWASERFGERIVTTEALAALHQPTQLHKKMADYVGECSDAEFCVLYTITTGLGSVLLGVATLENAFPDAVIFAAARVEEEQKKILYREDIYGSAPDQEKREALLYADLASAHQFLEAAKPETGKVNDK